jgi:hypothetical protein
MDTLDEDDKALLLSLVFEHYDLNYPNGSGNRSTHCPVHDDRHASASVNTVTGLWTCYSCQAGGDAYTLIMDKEGVTFTDAARIAQEILDRDGRAVRREPARKSGRGVSSRKGDRPSSRKYRPSWLDG